MSDAELEELCREIYRKHKRAIDLIVAHIPDKQALVQEALVRMVGETSGIRLRWHGKRQIVFHPEEWDVPALQYAEGKEAPALIFQFRLYNTYYMKILLEIRPASQDRRQRLFGMAVKHGKPFSSQTGKLGKKWNAVYSKLIVSKKQMPQMEATDIIAEAYKQWSLFIDNDLPVIKKALEDQEWVWTIESTDIAQSGETEEADEEDDEQ